MMSGMPWKIIRVLVGMTDEQVLLSWGKPEKINSGFQEGQKGEMWVYKDDKYLRFKNGKLIEILD